MGVKGDPTNLEWLREEKGSTQAGASDGWGQTKSHTGKGSWATSKGDTDESPKWI